jgi:hypothetical protein
VALADARDLAPIPLDRLDGFEVGLETVFAAVTVTVSCEMAVIGTSFLTARSPSGVAYTSVTRLRSLYDRSTSQHLGTSGV